MEDNNNFENPENGFKIQPDESNKAQSAPESFIKNGYLQPPEWTKNIVISDTPWPAPGEDGNVSVKLNESKKVEEDSAEENDINEITAFKKDWPMWLQIGIVVLAAVVATLLFKNALKLREKKEQTVITSQVTTTLPVTGTIVPTTAPISVIPSATTDTSEKNTDKSDEEVSSSSKEEKTTSDSGKKPSSDNKNEDPEAKEKIIEYFNESSNRVKTEAKKVVKNFEKRTHNEEKLVLPSAIKGVGKSLLEDRITDATEPVEYATAEEIIAKYPAPREEWSSKLTADDVIQAVCVEKDGEYEITLVLKSCIDPSPGEGTSRAMDCLDVPTVRDTAPPFITAFSAEYYDCVIRCRVEKKTGRVVWSNYTTPVVVKVGLDAGFAQFDAEIGFTFEKDYTVTY